MRTSIVIPTYNERENIKELLKQIFLLNIPELEVIIVDDSSPDGTAEIVCALKKRYPIRLISRPKKLGLGSALKRGLSLAKDREAAVVITMDADFSHSPKTIPELLDKIEQGADMVVGSRRIDNGKIQGWGPLRLFMSRLAMETARRILGIRTRDVTSGFRAYNRRVLDLVDIHKLASTGYAFQEEILYRAEQAGLKVVETPIQFIDRKAGKSKLGWRDIIEFFVAVIHLKFQ